MRLSLCFLAASLAFAQPDARELVRQSIANGRRAWEQSRQFSYTKTETDRQFDGQGRVRSVDVNVYEIVPVHGDSFPMLVEHDGKPVPPDQKQRQELALQRRENETPAQAARRLQKEKRDRDFYNEIPDAFNFRITGQENLPTGPAWVLEATPRPGFQPKSRYARMFPNMQGKLWIDQRDVQWVKADALATSNVTFGYFIATLSKGSHIILEQTRLPGGAWVPKRITAKANVRTFIFFHHNFDENIAYSDYRKGSPVKAASKSIPAR